MLSDVGNRKGYAGYELDDALAGAYRLYHVRNRVLNSDLGRWVRRDPLGYVDGASLYEYIRSNPGAGADPTGLIWFLRPNVLWPWRPPPPPPICPDPFFYGESTMGQCCIDEGKHECCLHERWPVSCIAKCKAACNLKKIGCLGRGWEIGDDDICEDGCRDMQQSLCLTP